MSGAQSNGEFRERKLTAEDFRGEAPSIGYSGLLSSAEFMQRMRPPSYMLDGILQGGMVYSLTGATGHGKTAIALLLALCVATGGQFGGRAVQGGSVLFLAGENPDNVRTQWYALCRDHGYDPANLPVHWHDGPFGIGAAAGPLGADAGRINNLRLVVGDTLQAFFPGDDDNNNMQMLAAAREFRALTRLPGRPTCVIPAHPIKSAGPENLLPRGGSAFLNEIDGNLTVWCRDGVATLHWHGKHRGAGFEPLTFEMVRVEPQGLVDEVGRQMPCTVARPVLTIREEELRRAGLQREDRALDAIRCNPKISVQGLAEDVGLTKSTAHRLLERLIKDRKWVKRRGRSLVLTPDGEAVLDG